MEDRELPPITIISYHLIDAAQEGIERVVFNPRGGDVEVTHDGNPVNPITSMETYEAILDRIKTLASIDRSDPENQRGSFVMGENRKEELREKLKEYLDKAGKDDEFRKDLLDGIDEPNNESYEKLYVLYSIFPHCRFDIETFRVECGEKLEIRVRYFIE